MMRVMMSVPPPTPAPTMKRIGRVGQSCAAAETVTMPRASAPSTRDLTPDAIMFSSHWADSPNRLFNYRRAPPPEGGGGRHSSSLLVLDRVAQNADALDLDLAGVAVPHPHRIGLAGMADARRRAGEDDVAGLEREALGEIDQHLAHREHHVVGVVGLHDLAVQPDLDLEALARVG